MIDIPDYKKKKVHRFTSPPKKGKARAEHSEDIQMRSSKKERLREAPAKSSMRVVKGKKLERRRRFKIFLSTAAVIAVVIAVLSFTLPAGLFENASNLFAVMGGGSYPVELYGSETINSVSQSSYYYVLTDTTLSAYSNAGKTLLTHTHGYSNPVLDTSATRALIFDQNGNSAYVCTPGGKEITVTPEKEIITAAISRSGAFAVATGSDSYASSVTVYDKNGNSVYTWNSAKDAVNCVAVSPSGDKLAVATVNAASGQLGSKVMVFEFDSADPVFSMDVTGEAVLSIENVKKSFCVLTSAGADIIEWSEYGKTEIKSELELDMFRSSSAEMLLVFNRSSDKSDNAVTVLSNKGEKLSEFTFNGIISDIAFAKGHIYCISDTKLYLFDRNGNLIRSVDCGYGGRRIAVLGSESAAVMTDSEITKIEIKE